MRSSTVDCNRLIINQIHEVAQQVVAGVAGDAGADELAGLDGGGDVGDEGRAVDVFGGLGLGAGGPEAGLAVVLVGVGGFEEEGGLVALSLGEAGAHEGGLELEEGVAALFGGDIVGDVFMAKAAVPSSGE